MTEGVKLHPRTILMVKSHLILKFIIAIKSKSHTPGIWKFAIRQNFGCWVQIRSQKFRINKFSKISKTMPLVESSVSKGVFDWSALPDLTYQALLMLKEYLALNQ